MAVILRKSGHLQLTKAQKHNLRNKVQMLGQTEPHRLRMFFDAGHGWLEVPVCKLSYLDLHFVDFSTYSYTNGRYEDGLNPFVWYRWSQGPMNDGGDPIHAVYLEEDCDAGIYLRRHHDVYGRKPIIQNIYLADGSGIRDLPPIYRKEEISI